MIHGFIAAEPGQRAAPPMCLRSSRPLSSRQQPMDREKAADATAFTTLLASKVANGKRHQLAPWETTPALRPSASGPVVLRRRLPF